MPLSRQTWVNNVSYANIGSVTVYFSDSSYVTKTISTIGATLFADDDRTPTKMSATGISISTSDGPKNFEYPDSSRCIAYHVDAPGTVDYPPMTIWQMDEY